MSRYVPKPSSPLWRLVYRYRNEVLRSWDLWLSLALAILTGIFLRPKPSIVFEVATVEAGVASALVGVILAGLAIITAFLDDSYVAVLAKGEEGVLPEVFQFRLTSTAAVASVVFDVGIIMVRDAHWLVRYRPLALAVSVFIFTYTLFCTLNLVALVGGHLALREKQVERQLDNQGEPEA